MASTATAQATQSEPEEFLFNEGEIKISKLRFIVGTQTYAMSGITSVKSESVPASAVLPVTLILCGMLSLLASLTFLAVLFFGCGVALFTARYGKHSVTLGTSGGEVRSYVSREESFIRKVVAALNEAIILRG